MPGGASPQRDERGVGVGGGRVARELLVDDEAALGGDEGGVDDVDGRGEGGDRGGEALDQGGVEGLGVCQGGDLTLVDQVEGGADVRLRWRGRRGGGCGGGVLLVLVVVEVGAGGARVVLGVERAHFLDQLDERLQFLVFFREDQGRVDGAAGKLAAEDGEDLFADVNADVFLGLDGRCAEVGGGDDVGVGDQFRGAGVRGWGLGGKDVDAGAGDVSVFERFV